MTTTIDQFLTGTASYDNIVIGKGPFVPGAVDACINRIRGKKIDCISVYADAKPVIVGEIISSPKSIQILRINSKIYNKIVVPKNIDRLYLTEEWDEGDDEFTAKFPMKNITFFGCHNDMSIARAFRQNNMTIYNEISFIQCSDDFIRRIGTHRNLTNVLKLDRYMIINTTSNHNFTNIRLTDQQITDIEQRSNTFSVNAHNNLQQFWRLQKLCNIHTLLVNPYTVGLYDNFAGDNVKIGNHYHRNERIGYFSGMPLPPPFQALINRTHIARPHMKKIYLLLLNPKLPKDLIREIRDILFA